MEVGVNVCRELRADKAIAEILPAVFLCVLWNVEEKTKNVLRIFSLVLSDLLPSIYCICFLHSCLSRLSELLWSHNIPLLVCRSYGLVGSIRLQVSVSSVST